MIDFFNSPFYKRLKNYSVEVIKLSDVLRKKHNYSIANQLIRSGTSIGANITEGNCSGTKKEFIRYFEIALKSSNETRYWLEIIYKISTNSKNQIQRLLNETIELSKIIASSIITMRKKK